MYFNLGMTISPEQLKAFEYYKKNCMSIEVVKDDYLQKVNFRVKNKVSLVWAISLDKTRCQENIFLNFPQKHMM